MKRHTLSFLFLFLMQLPLFGTSITNEELLKTCTDSTPGPHNFCYGFIISAANAAQFYRNIMDAEEGYIDICFPENISNKEIVEIYIAWAKKNLALAKNPAFIGVSSSFSTKYSCKPEKEISKESKKPSVYF
ncbi:MAG: hypothetical protein JSR85_01100 [Proteobacteria bacterium]|nr:hypothetical protein [Pseudomonadota bacterium]